MELTAAEWAWQFLRRNPEYRADYAWFIGLWRELEATYGAPPKRDFFRWRQDPRAWRSEADLTDCPSEGCGVEGDKVLIECWMGAKWGLRKFPIDPALERPQPGVVLDWREQVMETPILAMASQDYLQRQGSKIALGFDLALPLEPQLAQAKRQLIAVRRGLDKAGFLPPRTLAAGCDAWTTQLRLLDGAAADAGLEELSEILNLVEIEQALAEARTMASAGYRNILWLEI
jgi:hypothetical protein